MTELERFIDDQLADPGSMFRYGAWVDNNAKTIYFENPKVACTKIKRMLVQLGGYSLPTPAWRIHERAGIGHTSPDDLGSLSAPGIVERLESAEWHVFSFVRNPYDRLVSGYRSKVQSSLEGYDSFRDELAAISGSPANQITFGQFARFVCDQVDAARDTHWRTQAALLRPDLIGYDQIGRFENFASDLAFVLAQRWPNEQLPEPIEERVNSTSKGSWRSEYNNELAELVYRTYRIDFETFGYDPNSWLV